jgi:hypothetical protein
MDEYDYKFGQHVEVEIDGQPPVLGVVTGIAPERSRTDYFLVKYRDRTRRECEEWFASEELEALDEGALV